MFAIQEMPCHALPTHHKPNAHVLWSELDYSSYGGQGLGLGPLGGGQVRCPSLSPYVCGTKLTRLLRDSY